jgi:hypothetical protein
MSSSFPGQGLYYGDLSCVLAIDFALADDCYSGRSIIDEFLTLPEPVRLPVDRSALHEANVQHQKEIPGYYDQIKLPIAVNTIEVSNYSSRATSTLCRQSLVR